MEIEVSFANSNSFIRYNENSNTLYVPVETSTSGVQRVLITLTDDNEVASKDIEYEMILIFSDGDLNDSTLGEFDS